MSTTPAASTSSTAREPSEAARCEIFAAARLLCDTEGHGDGVHRARATPLVLSDRPGDRVELSARLTHWEREPGHPAEDEVVVSLGVELLELRTPAAVHEVRAQLSRLVDTLNQTADDLARLQRERLRQAVSDPTTELGQLLAAQEIPVLVADGPNAALLDRPLLCRLTRDGRDTLLLPPDAELPDTLAYVRETIPLRATDGSVENADPVLSTTRPEHTSIEDELDAYLAEHDLRLIREADCRRIEICRRGNDMVIIAPADTTPETTLDCARRHVTGHAPRIKHGRTWTYTDRPEGDQRTVTCPSFCRNDHSSDILMPTHGVDIWHQDHGVGVHVHLSDTNDPPVTWRVLEPQLAVIPSSDSPKGYEVPHVNVEFVEGVWTGPLGPDELSEFIETLADGLDKIRAMHAKLVTAQADWPTIRSA